MRHSRRSLEYNTYYSSTTGTAVFTGPPLSGETNDPHFRGFVIRGLCSAPPPPPPDDNKKKDNITPTDRSTLVKHWLDQLQSVPNVITVGRIVGAPGLAYLVVTFQYDYALAGCLVAGASDVLDGYIAKHYPNQSTVLGSYLDPLADKVIINVLAVSLCYNGILPMPLVGLWMARDVLLIGKAYRMVRSATAEGHYVIDPTTTPLQAVPTPISKVNTFLQFLTLSVGLVSPLVVLPVYLLEGLGWMTAGTTIASGWSYVGGASLTQRHHHKP